VAAAAANALARVMSLAGAAMTIVPVAGGADRWRAAAKAGKEDRRAAF